MPVSTLISTPFDEVRISGPLVSTRMAMSSETYGCYHQLFSRFWVHVGSIQAGYIHAGLIERTNKIDIAAFIGYGSYNFGALKHSRKIFAKLLIFPSHLLKIIP
jgi:hypothetical protein